MTADLIPDPPEWDKYEDAPKHAFTPDPLSGDCLVCGTACDPFGLRSEPALDLPVPEPDCCRDCWHDTHPPGECPRSLSPVRSVPCLCGRAA